MKMHLAFMLLIASGLSATSLYAEVDAKKANTEQPSGEVSPSGVSKIFAEEEELPMTTIIMPWRETAPEPIKEVPIQLVTEALVPIDPQVFQRQLQYYSAPLDYAAD